MIRIHATLTVVCLMLVSAPHAQPIAPLASGAHVAQVNGVRISYFVAGTGPLMIVQAPGWGLGSQYLRQGLMPMERYFTLVFYDTRGSGGSSRPRDERRMRTLDMINDLERLRQLWGLPTITLMGHSHGGEIALGYAIRYPTHVNKLLLVDSGILDFDFEPSIRLQFAAKAGDERFQDAIAHFKSGETISTDAQLNSFLGHLWPLYFYDPERYVPQFVASVSQTPSAWVFNKHPEADKSIKEDSVLNKVRARTLILAGRDDWVCGPVVAEHLRGAIPHSRLIILDSTGHFPWIEDPTEFFSDVIEFAAH
jgi:proline iminopeptidase